MVHFLSLQESGPDPGEAEGAAFRSVPACGGIGCCDPATRLTSLLLFVYTGIPPENKEGELASEGWGTRASGSAPGPGRPGGFTLPARQNPETRHSGDARILPC